MIRTNRFAQQTSRLCQLLLTTVVATGCGDNGDSPALLDPIRFSMTVEVAPGEEAHACQFVKMPDEPGEIFVGGGTYSTTLGTHHFLLFRTAPDMPEQALGVPIDCNEGDGVMRYERGYVTGGQRQTDSAEFPAGLALAFAPGEVLLMQMHTVNATSEPVAATVDVELTRVSPSTVLNRVGTFRFYNPFIHVPAGGTATAAMRCPIQQDVTLLSAGAHMHARGVAYRAFVDSTLDAPSAEPFYTTTTWQHPDYFTGLISLPAGSAIRFACDYDNPTGVDVTQGTSVDDEMCMLSAFYYPAQDEAQEICAAMDQHGTGDRNCAQTSSCIQLCDRADFPDFAEGSAKVGACFQKCIVESCPNVTGALFPQLLCSAEHCEAACETLGAACSNCVLDNCKAELDHCQTLSCEG